MNTIWEVLFAALVDRRRYDYTTEIAKITDVSPFTTKRGKLAGQNESESRLYPWHCFGDPHEILKGYKIMGYLLVVPPEEMKEREEVKKAKDEARRSHREKVKNAKVIRKKRK